MTNPDKWKEIKRIENPGPGAPKVDSVEFKQLLKNSDMDEDIAQEVLARIEEIDVENNILFVFTENEYVVTAIHVPAESIDEQDGPVLMRGAGDKSIIAAFSRELILQKIDIIDNLPPGLPLVADEKWVEQLEEMVEDVKMEMSSNPPARWEELLNGEDY
jgi:hypothetical protein